MLSIFYAVVEGSLNPDGPQFRPWDPNNLRSLKYRAYSTQTPGRDEDWFEAQFGEVNPSTVQCKMLLAPNPNYLGKGIPEAVFKDLSSWLGKAIVSSSNKQRNPWDVNRNPNADKVWQRLESAGHATYDARTDRFTYIP